MGKVYNKLIKWYGIVITKDKDNLNVRSGPGIEYKQCTFSPLKYGTKIGYCDEELDANGNTWYYIKYNGKYGFVELDAKDVNAVSAPVYSNKRDILRFNGESWVNEKFPDLAFIEEIYVKLPDESDTLNKVKTEYYQGEVFDPKGI